MVYTSYTWDMDDRPASSKELHPRVEQFTDQVQFWNLHNGFFDMEKSDIW
jgi:hypothetical protein